MSECKQFKCVWKPPMLWRIKQAWNLIRRGRFNISMDYKVNDKEATIWIDNEYIGEISR